MTVSFSFTVSSAPAATPATAPTSAQTAGADAIRDMKLDSTTGDIVLDDTGDLVFVSGLDAIASDLKSRWLTFKEEWFLDLDMGVDYWGIVFKKNPDQGAIEQEFRREALETPGIDLMKLQLQRATNRRLDVTAVATTDTGEIFKVALGVAAGE